MRDIIDSYVHMQPRARAESKASSIFVRFYDVFAYLLADRKCYNATHKYQRECGIVRLRRDYHKQRPMIHLLLALQTSDHLQH